MFEIVYTKLLVTHVLSVMIAVGTVTVTDYLHLLGLRDPQFEKKSLFVFPHLSKLIWMALAAIYVTGTAMVVAKPSILQGSLFWLKLFLVLLVTINGLVLHVKIFPQIEKVRKKYPLKLIKQASFCGSLSVVSWYAIVVLAITKTMGYSPLQFFLVYVVVLFIAYKVALHVELNKRGT